MKIAVCNVTVATRRNRLSALLKESRVWFGVAVIIVKKCYPPLSCQWNDLERLKDAERNELGELIVVLAM